MLINKKCHIWGLNSIFFTVIVLKCLCEGSVSSKPDETAKKELTLAALVASWGYDVEFHSVTTEDHYVLGVFRLPVYDSPKASVFLQHGILACSGSFLANKRGLPYYLRDQGYDVWIGNARGTRFSRKHVIYSEESPEFWDFSFHEMGIYDIPAVLHFIRDNTGQQKVHYVGHSMGTTMFLVMASCRPEELSFVNSVTLLAPVARPVHMTMIKSLFTRKFLTMTTTVLPSLGITNYQFHGWIAKLAAGTTQKPKAAESIVADEVAEQIDKTTQNNDETVLGITNNKYHGWINHWKLKSGISKNANTAESPVAEEDQGVIKEQENDNVDNKKKLKWKSMNINEFKTWFSKKDGNPLPQTFAPTDNTDLVTADGDEEADDDKKTYNNKKWRNLNVNEFKSWFSKMDTGNPFSQKSTATDNTDFIIADGEEEAVGGVIDFDYENTQELVRWYYDGTSFKNHKHFLQMAETGKFQKFDYGEAENERKYGPGCQRPPEYELRKIKKRTYLICGGKDEIAQLEDVEWLHARLQNSWLIVDGFEKFDHGAFNFGVGIDLVHTTVKTIIEAAEDGREPNLKTAERTVPPLGDKSESESEPVPEEKEQTDD